MSAPGITRKLTDAPIPRSPAGDVSTLFISGVTAKGPTDKPYPCNSLDAYIAQWGERTAASAAMYDYAETFFACGGASLYVTRRVGPAAVKATVNLFDQAGSTAPGDVALVATAKNAGAWANTLNVAVTVSGTDFTIVVTDDTDTTINENSGTLADRAAAVAWATTVSTLIDLTLGASNEDPRAVAAASSSLASGADDVASLTDALLIGTLALATDDYGPGMVDVPNLTTTAGQQAILDHCAAHFRTALITHADSASASTLAAASAALRSSLSAHAGGAFAPWAVIRGYTVGTTRTVPWSAVAAGMTARNDANGISTGQPAAGRYGIPPDFVTGLSQPAWSEADRALLNDAGVNVVRVMGQNEIRAYGNRTFVNPVSRPAWVELSGSRVAMIIANLAGAILEDAMYAVIDGRGFAIAKVGGDLTALCQRFYGPPNNALYGETSDDAFFVDVGPTVNTPTTIANRQLNAKLELSTSPAAENVNLTISKQQIA